MTSMKALSLYIWMLVMGIARHAEALEFSTAESAGKRFTVCRIDVRKERLQLFLNDDSGQPFRRLDRLSSALEAKGKKLIFAMNAGMFDRNFSPVGLMVAGGKQSSALNTATGEGNFFLKPNGVFLISDSGARVIETSEYPITGEAAIIATQSGPLLLRSGKIHSAFKPASTNRFIRNGVGVASTGIAVIVISEDPVSFHEFATVFRDKLDCPDALYLDGVISSLHSAKLRRTDSRLDLGPILAITN